MVNKTRFFAECPKTRVEFVKKYNSDYVFKSKAETLGFNVIGDNVIFPNGAIANSRVK